VPTAEELELLGRKVTQLKLAYDQYFLGSRPREPVLLRDEVRKLVLTYTNQSLKNTALRFKFNSITSRYQAFKRQWTDTIRKIENGEYERHQFKAKLHQGGRPEMESTAQAPQDRDEVYAAFLEARQACGQSVENLTSEALKNVLDKQEGALRERFGDCTVRFKVVVEGGKAKLCASRSG
jgi:hypothetical protein